MIQILWYLVIYLILILIMKVIKVLNKFKHNFNKKSMTQNNQI
jgi:hypothetical protein